MTHKKQGAVNALLGEYEKAVAELKSVLQTISNTGLVTIVDPKTDNPDCKSIQTVLAHVVGSGYSYNIYIQDQRGGSTRKREKILRDTVSEYLEDLDNVVAFTRLTFADIEDDALEVFDDSKKIKTNWEQSYDIEQLMEHAIVHILRHRRQIEKFKALLQE